MPPGRIYRSTGKFALAAFVDHSLPASNRPPDRTTALLSAFSPQDHFGALEHRQAPWRASKKATVSAVLVSA